MCLQAGVRQPEVATEQPIGIRAVVGHEAERDEMAGNDTQRWARHWEEQEGRKKWNEGLLFLLIIKIRLNVLYAIQLLNLVSFIL